MLFFLNFYPVSEADSLCYFIYVTFIAFIILKLALDYFIIALYEILLFCWISSKSFLIKSNSFGSV